MIITVSSDDNENISRIEYVLEYLNNHPLNDGQYQFQFQHGTNTTHLFYGKMKQLLALYIPRQQLIFTKTFAEPEKLTTNLYSSPNGKVYSVEEGSSYINEFFKNNMYGFDWIETIFFHISRYEEFVCRNDQKDQWDMMREEYQFLVRHGIHHIPVVDHLVWVIFKTLGSKLKPPLTTVTWTHDLDAIIKYKSPYRALRAFIRRVLDGHGLSGAVRLLKRYWKVKSNQESDPFLNFEWLLIDHQEERIRQKIIFIMTGGTSPYDNYYRATDPRLPEIINLALNRGYRIGLHGSYNSFENEDMLRNELKALSDLCQCPVLINRQHFLHYSFGTTDDILERTDIYQDSTLGYQRKIGFRCGTGYSYSLYNFKKEKAYQFKELPLVVMDGALVDESNSDLHIATQLISKFCKQNQFGTHITFNFHNSFFDPDKRDIVEYKNLYFEILNFYKSRNAEL